LGNLQVRNDVGLGFLFCIKARGLPYQYKLKLGKEAGDAEVIICSCNVLSDHDVRSAVKTEAPPRSAGQVYGCLGCSAQCGRCARTIRKIMDEALAAACGDACGCGRCKTA
jgi:bacterioferritin-associated ferredoxin